MKTITEQLTMYAKYHRDPRNIVTHFVGIPLIVVAIAILLARPSFELVGVAMAPIHLVVFVTSIYYLRLSFSLGVLMVALLGMAVWCGVLVSSMSTSVWLALGIGLFVVGWLFQFVGHFYEGKKPAFVDDLVGLLIGPLFVVCEVLFKCGLLKQLQGEIESGAGEVKYQTGSRA